MRRLHILLIIILLSFTLIGCGIFPYEKDADAFIAEYFEFIKAKDFETALDFYSADYFQNISKSEMQQLLESRYDKFGDMQKYWVIKWRTRYMYFIGGPDKGKEYFRCEMVLKVTYSFSSTIEKYIVTRDIESGVFAIIGYDGDYPDYQIFRLLPF